MKLASLAFALIATTAQYGVLAAAAPAAHATETTHTSKAPWSMGPLQAKVGWPSKMPLGPVWLNQNQRAAGCIVGDGNEVLCSSPGTGMAWKEGHNPWLGQSAEACDLYDAVDPDDPCK
jgi:hypothetical protein